MRAWQRGLLLAGLAAASPGAQAGEAPACSIEPAFSQLDFWIGEWDVYADGQRVGGNRITRILDGCAISEEWTDASGREGRSLFYFHPGEGTWKQVWVTQHALARGGTKEKTLIERLAGGGLRFQGEVGQVGGAMYLDRTTLTPESDGEVRQLIEISTDGGQDWQPVFDARYRRRAPPAAPGGESGSWFLVQYEKGAAWDDALPPAEQLGFAAHSAAIQRLRDEGAVAFGARYAEYGMLLVRADSADAVHQFAAADAAVQSGIFEVRVEPLRVFYPWRE